MQPKRILLHVGGGRLQVPGLSFARDAGLEVVVTDADPLAPGRAAAARFEPIPGDDVDALVRLAEELAAQGELAGAYCSNDFGLPAVAAIGAATGTPANSPEAVAAALDKGRSSELWEAAGVATPLGRVVLSLEEAHAAFAELGVPAIVKPVGSSGSRGVRRVRRADELAPAYTRARSFGERVRLEQHESGRHLDVNAILYGGELVRCGLLERFFGPAPACVPTWGVQPPELDARLEEDVWSLVERAAAALGLTIGPLKADVILTESGPVLLELAPRFHGDVSSAHVSPLCLPKSPVRAWFDALARPDEPLEFEDEPFVTAGWMAILPERTGVFLGAQGEEEARDVPGVAGIAWIKRPGARLVELEDNRAVCGFLWAVGASPREVHRRMEQARSEIELWIE